MQQKSKTRAELLEKVLFLKGFSRIKTWDYMSRPLSRKENYSCIETCTLYSVFMYCVHLQQKYKDGES